MEEPVYRLEGVVKARSEDMVDFVGPLDLILHLLGKNKMEIKDIQISLLLDQYMEWMEKRKSLDLEVASEFVAMAAHLVYIKTRMLLSIHDEEALSEMEELIASLEARQRHEDYEKIRAAVVNLESWFALGRDYLTKAPELTTVRKTYRYSHEPDELKGAMAEIISRAEGKLPPPMAAFEGIVGREPYPVAEKAAEILRKLLRFGVARFRALFAGDQSRSEIVATFIAVLELCKARKVRLAGTESDCTVTFVQNDDDRAELETDNY